jgi:hypothetical protein
VSQFKRQKAKVEGFNLSESRQWPDSDVELILISQEVTPHSFRILSLKRLPSQGSSLSLSSSQYHASKPVKVQLELAP